MEHKSKALLYDEYGQIDKLRIGEITLNSPKPDEVLVKVMAAALNPKDILVRKGKFQWITGKKFPKIVGLDFAGIVEEAGASSPLKKGDAVFGCLNEFSSCRGTLADYVLVKNNEVALMPKTLNFAEAASLPLTSQTSLQALRDIIHLTTGQSILILGASGGVGVSAIQIAKALGAHVTTTSSEKNLEFCKSLGADKTLDYAKDIFLSPDSHYDAIFDVYGNQSFVKVLPALSKKGCYVTTVPSKQIFWDAFKTLFSLPKARFVYIRSNTKDLNEIAKMADDGLLKPIIDKTVRFEDYRSAIAHLETRRAKGKVVIINAAAS